MQTVMLNATQYAGPPTCKAVHSTPCTATHDATCSATSQPGVMAGCNVTSLDLQKNHIGDRGAESLGRALTANRALCVLRLGNNAVPSDGLAQ